MWSTNNVDKHKGGSCEGESVTIHKSVSIDISITKGDGNRYECAKGYREGKTWNHE